MLASLLASAVLAATFQPPSAHLLEGSLRPPEVLTQAALAQAEPLAPPAGDPYAKSFRGREFGLGAALVAAMDVSTLVVGGIAALYLFAGILAGSNDVAGAAIWVIIIFAALEVGLTPLFAALVGNGLAGPRKAGSLGKAVGLAYAAQAVALVLAGVMSAVTRGQNGGLVFLGWAAGHNVLMPLAVSYGLHWGDSSPEPVNVPVVAPPPGPSLPEAPPAPQLIIPVLSLRF